MKKVGICTSKDLTNDWCGICNHYMGDCDKCPLYAENMCYDEDPGMIDYNHHKLQRIIKIFKKTRLSKS